MATKKQSQVNYSQTEQTQMKTRPLTFLSSKPYEGLNTYEGPNASKAGAGRGSVHPPMSKKWVEKK